MTDTTRYLIARDGAGNIIAKRATLGYHHYKFATSAGTFHTRRDLVPTGKIAWPVEEISAAEYRALVKAKTDDPVRLQAKVDRWRKSVEHNAACVAEAAERLRAALAGEIPVGSHTYRMASGPREVTGFVFPGSNYPTTEDNLRGSLASCERWLAEARKSLANYEKRLATALRKAAKAS